MLDLGESDFAFQIAQCGLDVWKKEADESYHCFEHFTIETGRGAGWHQFTGLSSPVMSWFGAYYRPGRFTCGFDAWIRRQRFSEDNTSFEAALHMESRQARQPCVIVTLNPGRSYRCSWNGADVPSKELLPGCLSVSLPVGATQGELKAFSTTQRS